MQARGQQSAFCVFYFQRFGQKCTYPCSDDHHLGDDVQALVSGRAPAHRMMLQTIDQLAQMNGMCKGAYLLLQPLNQLEPGAHRNPGDVINRLVRIQLGALATDMGKGINNVAAQAQQPQLKRLVQPHRASTDDEGVGLDQVGTGVNVKVNAPVP